MTARTRRPKRARRAARVEWDEVDVEQYGTLERVLLSLRAPGEAHYVVLKFWDGRTITIGCYPNVGHWSVNPEGAPRPRPRVPPHTWEAIRKGFEDHRKKMRAREQRPKESAR